MQNRGESKIRAKSQLKSIIIGVLVSTSLSNTITITPWQRDEEVIDLAVTKSTAFNHQQIFMVVIMEMRNQGNPAVVAMGMGMGEAEKVCSWLVKDVKFLFIFDLT